MKEKNKIIIGNMTTIINTISLGIAGLIFGTVSALGLKLPVDQYSLAGVIGLLIGLAFSYFNAKYHNTFFDSDDDTLTINTTNLSEEQVTAIQNFIDNATQLNSDFSDDPSLAYEEGEV